MAAAQVEQVQLIDLARLDVHRSNPRTDVGDIRELAESIKAQGMVEPIIAVRDNGGFAIVAGSRRAAAARLAGLPTVPVIVRELTDEQIAAAALIENLQRKDLNPLEEARGYRAWLDLTKKKQTELAAAVGKAPSTIANALRLLDAAPAIQTALEKGEITAAHAKVAMSLPENALPLIELKDVSVHELESQAKAAQRSFTSIERLRGMMEKATAAGKTVTWATGQLWLGGVDVDLVRAFGEPPKKIQGNLRYGGYGTPDKSTHDAVCDCNAVALVRDGDALEPVCVSSTGWKKAQERSRKNMGQATPAKRKKAKTADDRRKEQERDTKAAIREADEALNFKKLNKYHPLKTDMPAPLLRGGIAGEPARLVLFGQVVENSGGSNKSKTWEVELWKKIAKLPLLTVREYVTKWAVAGALEEIRGTNRYKSYGSTATGLGQNNASVITQLVNAHYGVRAKTKKAAKR